MICVYKLGIVGLRLDRILGKVKGRVIDEGKRASMAEVIIGTDGTPLTAVTATEAGGGKPYCLNSVFSGNEFEMVKVKFVTL